MNRGFVPARIILFLTLLTLFLLVSFSQPTVSATTQEVSPQGATQELSIDDGTADCTAGTQASFGGKNFGWANKLTPSTYPATLRTITIGFDRTVIGHEVRQDALYRIVVYADPEKDGPADNQDPVATFTGRVRGTDEFMTFNLVTPVTITSGSFVIGAIDDFGFGSLPALFDIPGKSTPPGSESYLSFDGGNTWRTQADVLGNVPSCLGPQQGSAGSWLIRATVESDPVAVPTITKIQDLAAVEPWGVAVNRSRDEVYVTNYVSDNVTVLLTNSSVQNIPVGDGTGGSPDGPFGVAVDPNGNKVYVTLFGSNTIPSKEFPIDYSAISAGRVAVLTRQANNSFTQTNQITVGKGPKFPAVVSTNSGVKLYVPCGGTNRVDVINTATNEKVREIAVGLEPSSCTASLDSAKLYVTNFGDGTISVIDTRTDTKIKDISIPPTTPLAPGMPPLPALKNPVSAVVSPSNGNLYVTYNRADDSPNGAIVEINTCSDTLARVVADPSTIGTPAGAAGATGIAAPTSALLRDAMTGLTPNAGGGGGGPFGIAVPTLTNKAVVFTNDGLGIIGMLDTRTDQVVTAPPLIIANSPKPRGIACKSPPPPPCVPPCVPPEIGFTAYVALGQPDNAIAIILFPALTENIADVPVINSVDIGKKLFVNGKGFVNGTRIEVTDPETGVCLTFAGKTKVSFEGDQIIQKGTFSDGRSIKSVLKAASVVYLRVVNPDGVSRVFVKQQ